MKLKQQVLAAVVAGASLLGLGFWFGSASASGTEPGSIGDPLVSKSYVDQLVANLADKSYVDARMAGQLDKSYIDERIASLPDKTYVDSRLAFQVVNVPAGSAVIGEAGTEIVLRGGKATAIASPLGGLFDATGGLDIFQGEQVKPNHLLVVPRPDGRGLLATADLILLVKGNYTIQAGTP